MKKEKITSFILLALLFATTSMYAIPAFPDPIVYTQPDGTTLTVMIRGDERIHWHETLDGYTLLYNQEGFLTYAYLDEYENLQPSNFVATDIEARDTETLFFLNNIEVNLFYSDVQQQMILKIWEIEDEYAEQSKGITLTGQCKTICAFADFPEKAFIKSMTEFDPLFNQLGYTGTGVYGSVRDYFKECSYDKFDIEITLCGPFTAPQSEAYYAGPPGDGVLNVPQLARWLAQQVEADPNINFADYDCNNDGKVNGFHFIFAGVGQETGGCNTCIWSHKYQFNPPVTKNGKSISIYSCSPELRSGTNINTIGVVCHEMSHAVHGAYDFYDTNYGQGGQYIGTGSWDIMADGSYNGNPSGSRPPHHNMFSKIQFGWVNPTTLNMQTTVTDMPNAAENDVAYRINTTTNNEYYLLENRQRIKFDTNVPGDGLLIYHVHSQVTQAGMQNTVNTTHPQRMYPVCASRTTQMPTNSPSSYGSINSAGCPFPGTSNKTSFTDVSIPAMLSWANANTNKPITNITHSNRLISFVFMGSATTYTITATCDDNGTITPAGVTNVYEGGSQAYTITPKTHYERETVLINGTNNTAAVSSGTYTFSGVTSNQTIHATFKPTTYTVSFYPNGGDGDMAPQDFTYGVEQKLTANSFFRPEYKFEKWNTYVNGNGTSYSDEQTISISSNISLYAQWEGLGIEDISANSPLQIIPNPANEYIDLQVTNDELQATNVEFFDVLGQLVKSVPFNNVITQRISITDLSKGIYFVKVGNATTKLVVQ